MAHGRVEDDRRVGAEQFGDVLARLTLHRRRRGAHVDEHDAEEVELRVDAEYGVESCRDRDESLAARLVALDGDECIAGCRYGCGLQCLVARRAVQEDDVVLPRDRL